MKIALSMMRIETTNLVVVVSDKIFRRQTMRKKNNTPIQDQFTESELEQIEEMARIIDKPCVEIFNEADVGDRDCPFPFGCHECMARQLYKAGFHRQIGGSDNESQAK